MNREEFISYVEDCQGSLRRFLTALCCGDSYTADDIAQETLIKAWLSCDDFRCDSSFDTWVRRIAYNTFLNHRRSLRPHDDLSQTIAVESRNRADDAFNYQALYDALGRLSEKERTSVALYYLDGYAIQEIADIEGVSADAVKQHLSRGRTHLRRLINPHD